MGKSMGVEFSIQEVSQALTEIDADDGDETTDTHVDGQISFDELLNWMVKNRLWFDPETNEDNEFAQMSPGGGASPRHSSMRSPKTSTPSSIPPKSPNGPLSVQVDDEV